MGLSEQEFWDMTPKAFFLKHEGFMELEQSHRRDAWERGRLFTTMQLNLWMKKGQKLTPKKLLRFDWEKKPKGEPVKPDKERFERMVKKWGGKLPGDGQGNSGLSKIKDGLVKVR